MSAVMLELARLLIFTYVVLCLADATDTCSRISCVGKTEIECMNYGCCWDTQNASCFFSSPNYYVLSISEDINGVSMILTTDTEGPSGEFPGSPISPLKVDIIRETSHRLHIKISDPNNERWEIPDSLLPLPSVENVDFPAYEYKLPSVGQKFYFIVAKFGSDQIVFDTSSCDFIYANQLLRIGTSRLSTTNIYGFGEHKTSLKLDTSQYTLWNYAGGTPSHVNLYGSHPFYLAVDEHGSAHGVFLRNSNGMDIDLTDTQLQYSVIGGILDFYFFMGPDPDDVIFQYYEVIGCPAMPPYWALGYHQSRWGYTKLQEVKDVVDNFVKNQIPLDTMWTDIDYMDKYKDFTTDPVNFPPAALKEFIEELHKNGQHYVLVTNPGISITKDYQPYEDGVAMDIFMKDKNGKLFAGNVWPGYIAFPDFAFFLTTEYWMTQISDFHEKVPMDGMLLDMNEPSNTCSGPCNISKEESTRRSTQNFDPNNPPYVIGNRREKGKKAAFPLNNKTLSMDATHRNGDIAYNMHNLYGLSQSIATRTSFLSITGGKRPFVVSRSTFAGSGSHAAHWLGDVASTAADLNHSISTILSFQLLGIPFVGADICGFQGDTSEELCARWMEVGSFYPFARNHNSKHMIPQEPYRWPSVAAISRKYLAIRYSLLPYYYTLFFMASHKPEQEFDVHHYPCILQPLFFEFFDTVCPGIEDAFLVGGGLYVVPQLRLGPAGKTLDIYLPKDVWYDWYTDELVSDGSSAKFLNNVPTPVDHLPLYIRGGFIIPMQDPGLTTTESRYNPYSLLVALKDDKAVGSLYLDDGESEGTKEQTFISYMCSNNEVVSVVSGTKYATKASLPLLQRMTVLGVKFKPSRVLLDGLTTSFIVFNENPYTLLINDLAIHMDHEFHLMWQI